MAVTTDTREMFVGFGGSNFDSIALSSQVDSMFSVGTWTPELVTADYENANTLIAGCQYSIAIGFYVRDPLSITFQFDIRVTKKGTHSYWNDAYHELYIRGFPLVASSNEGIWPGNMRINVQGNDLEPAQYAPVGWLPGNPEPIALINFTGCSASSGLKTKHLTDNSVITGNLRVLTVAAYD